MNVMLLAPREATELDDCYEVAHGFKVGVNLGRRRVNEDRSEDGSYGQGGSRTWHPSGPEKSLIQQPSGSALFQSRSQSFVVIGAIH